MTTPVVGQGYRLWHPEVAYLHGRYVRVKKIKTIQNIFGQVLRTVVQVKDLQPYRNTRRSTFVLRSDIVTHAEFDMLTAMGGIRE